MITSIHKNDTFTRCPRRYYLRFGKRLVGRHKEMPMRVGLAVHSFTEFWYKNQTIPFADRIEAARQEMVKSLQETQPPTSVRKIEEEIIHRTTRLVQGYVRKYGENDEFAVFEPEVEGIVDIPGGHKFRFRTDAPVNFNGQLWVLENKTTGKNIQETLTGYCENHQPISYCYGVSVKLKRPVAGVILNVMRRETDRISLDFHREYLPVGPRQIRNTIISLAATASDIESRDLNDINQWPLYTHSCRGCQYRRICWDDVDPEPGPLFMADERPQTPKEEVKELTQAEE